MTLYRRRADFNAGLAGVISEMKPTGDFRWLWRVSLSGVDRTQARTCTVSAGAIVIAFSPAYATIRLAAPIIVLIGRLLRGLSTGVEIGGVSIYLFEIATPGKMGFYTAFQSSRCRGRSLSPCRRRRS